MLGLSCGVIGGILNTLAVSYGDILILSSSSALTLMFNSVFSRLFLKENFSLKYDGISMIFILLG